MIELLILLSVIFLIYVFFYKQSISDYTILQLEYGQIQKLNETLLEKAPVIVKNIEIPHCIQKESLLRVQRFANIYIGSCNLIDYLDKKECKLQVPNELQLFLANETGFNSYANNSWLDKLHVNPLSSYISSLESKVCFGSYHLQKTSAIWSIIMPVESRYVCSLVNPNYESSLTKDYKSITNLESLEAVKGEKQLQFIDVILKPESILILPPHWFYIMRAEEAGAYYTLIEYHEPVSLLNTYLERKV